MDKSELWKKRLYVVFSHDYGLTNTERAELEEMFAEIFSQINKSCLLLYGATPHDNDGYAGNIKRSAFDFTTVLLRLYLSLWFKDERGMRQYNEVVKVILEEVLNIKEDDPIYSRYIIPEEYFKLHDEEIDESMFEDK